MAFRDENGKITIDENAALNDINKLNLTISQLEQAYDLVTQINYLSTDMQGNTATVINSVSTYLMKEISDLMSYTDNTKDNITKIVNKYQAIDKKIKEIIEL